MRAEQAWRGFEATASHDSAAAFGLDSVDVADGLLNVPFAPPANRTDTRFMTQPLLFTPLAIRDVTFKNRVVIAPMATYSAIDGIAQD